MKSQQNPHLSDLELCIMNEAEQAISNLLGIRIHFHAKIMKTEWLPDLYLKNGWIFTIYWESMRGLRFYCSHDTISEIFAMDEQKDLDKDQYVKQIQRYVTMFAEDFSNRLSFLFTGSWLIKSVNIEMFINQSNRQMPFRVRRFLDVSIGNKYISDVMVSVEPELLRAWRDNWKALQIPFDGTVALDQKQSVYSSNDSIRFYKKSQLKDSFQKELPISAELGKAHIQFKQLLNLGPGDILDLDKIQGDPVDLYLSNKKIAEGRIVQSKGNIGIQLTALIGLHDRMHRLI